MAITLTFTDEQLGGDIDLQGSTEGVISYDPKPPASEGAISVTDTVVLYIDSGAKAARTTNGYLHRLERFFERARRRQKLKTGLKVYVKYKPYDADVLYRSEVLDGRIVWATDTTRPAWLPSDKGECAIIFTRRPYWEHDTEQELPLANTGDSGTGGIAIVNHNDSGVGDDHWVLIEGTDVVGSLPAPLRVQFTGNNNLANYIRVWACHTIETDDGTGNDQIWTLEGEDNEESPDTPVSNGDSSGGFYMPQQWTATTETLIFEWTVASVYLYPAAGNPFRAIARLVSQGYSNLQLRLSITAGSVGELWSSQIINATANDEIVDFGTIPALPPQPGSVDASGYEDHLIRIYATRATSGTHTVNLDYLQLLPIDGGFRYIESAASGTGIASGTSLTDDGIEMVTYLGVPGGSQWGIFVGSGEWLKVVPGRIQRIAFVYADSFRVAEATQEAIIRLYYRPRRASF